MDGSRSGSRSTRRSRSARRPPRWRADAKPPNREGRPAGEAGGASSASGSDRTVVVHVVGVAADVVAGIAQLVADVVAEVGDAIRDALFAVGLAPRLLGLLVRFARGLLDVGLGVFPSHEQNLRSRGADNPCLDRRTARPRA